MVFVEELVVVFGDDIKVCMVVIIVFLIVNKFGDFICIVWCNILDCILWFYKLGFLFFWIVNDVIEDIDVIGE